MKSLATISALVAVAVASPSPHVRKDIRQARLTVQHQKQTSLTEITIKNQATPALFGYACSKSLSSDRFVVFSVTADLDPVVLKPSPSGLTPTVFKRTPNTQEVSSA
jgi:hypothetical protein